MNQVLNMAQFLKIHPLDSNKSVLINIHQITAVEEIVDNHILRIHVGQYTYETGASLEDLLLILNRTATISRL
ncbi:hypothetical protein [Moraxella oblonga]|uniref:hypothetical protein n=1 Tax=Moraxella oblonga TaxID=200413 RepID=UPI000829D96C|nr:hypothetical protein [Moraxella oblonga]